MSDEADLMKTIRQLASVLIALTAFALPESVSWATTSTSKEPAAATSVPATATTDDPSGAPPLTKVDADAWLDGFLPYALASADVAGAVVVIVKDGSIVTERGFGYADVAANRKVDPHDTLFRPGSTSKLFTWTAVMQLVEAGKIDLDRDVNTYLDFKVPTYEGEPLTMRQIMTHTSGFEEALNGLFVHADRVPSLQTFVHHWTPARIFPPGTTPAYSNYATALAGYIVQRVSGEPFDAYIEHHIFRPLGMSHSTFDQPLPPTLAAEMSKGYRIASQPPHPFEMIAGAPAGSLTTNADDMARFMLAHLDIDRELLMKAATAREMHDTALTVIPPLNRMELGFYEQNLNGHRIIGHGGDTQWFHSYLWLLLNQKVGIFYSQNSAGRGAASLVIRESLIDNFVDRYFPPTAASPASFQPRPRDAAAMAGTYQASRRSQSGLRRALNFFGQTSVAASASGGLRIEGFEFAGANGAPRNFVEIGPFLWQELNGHERLAATVQGERVIRFSVDSVAPFTVFEPVPWYISTTWLRPAVLIGLVVLLGMAVSPLVGWAARRSYGVSKRLEGSERTAYRASVSLAVAALLIVGVWLAILLPLTFDPLGPSVYLLQLTTVVLLPALCIVSAWFVWTAVGLRRGAFTLGLRVAVLLAGVVVSWVAVAFGLTHFGLDY
jgi:CubicO group peptidase (beta-lactamase class C family)